MKRVIVIIASILIVISAVSLPRPSLANNAVFQAAKTSSVKKQATPTPTKISQKSVQGASSQSTSSASTKYPTPPIKGATPIKQLPVTLSRRPVAASSAKVKTPTPTMKIVRIAGQLAAYEVSSKSGNTIVVKKKNQTVTVKILTTTEFRQHYWGSTSLANTSVGDKVNVTGVFIDQKKTIMEAQLIRNLSVLKRRGVTFGTITTVTSGTITIQPKDIPLQKVSINSSTKILSQDEKPLLRKELKVGDRVRIKGLSDRSTNTITEVSEIKDFSQKASTMSATLR